MIDIQSWKEAVLKFRNARAAGFKRPSDTWDAGPKVWSPWGSYVERFRPGDAVFGDLSSFGFGGYIPSRNILSPLA
jgi:hypothetical protein